MIRPLEAFIGWRYARTREAGFFVSFITGASLIGVALGIAALIAILSVMNGFEAELRTRLLSLSAHATLSAESGIADWPARRAAVLGVPGVSAVAPYLQRQALVTRGEAMTGAMLRGVDPALEPTVSTIAANMVSGELSALVPGSDRIVLGRALAAKLGLSVGDAVTVMIPQPDPVTGEIAPRARTFAVSGIFEVGLADHDSVLALVSLADAEALADRDRPDGLRLRCADVYTAPRLARVAAARLGDGIVVRDWTEENATYFRAIRIEKTMMTLMLMLVVGVAAFNIVGSLVMVVRSKRTDIAILRTLGMRRRGIVGVFLAQGLVIGWAGTAIGVVLGVVVARNADAIMSFLQRALHFQVFSADVYYVTRIPSVVVPVDVALIAAAGFLLTLAATVYPALKASSTEPAEVLRYE